MGTENRKAASMYQGFPMAQEPIGQVFGHPIPQKRVPVVSDVSWWYDALWVRPTKLLGRIAPV